MTSKILSNTNKKLKVITVVGTRPEIIRLSEIIKKCDQYFDHTLIHTGQNWDYTLNQIFFEDLALRAPDHYLDAVGEDLGDTIGSIIAKSYRLFCDLKPEALLLLGDTNSALCAIGAKRLKIPIFHMEAGNRCFDQNVPEEINRKLIDHISDINLPYTEHSRRYLIAEGIRPDHILVTGSPMTEVLRVNQDKIKHSDVLTECELTDKGYFLLSLHREENVDSPSTFAQIIATVNGIAQRYQLPIVFSVHPRTRRRLTANDIQLDPLVKMTKPFSFSKYCKLQKHAYCVISDSGTLSEESAMLEFPAISIRTSTERPEGIDKGNFILASLDVNTVLNSISIAVDTYHANNGLPEKPIDYYDVTVSDKIIKIIQGYTSVVNDFVWRKR
jgi:UDP-N-acetyl-L-fucosamine synthase